LTVGFEQAAIRVEREREFGELKAALQRAFADDEVTKFLKRLESRNIRIRDLDVVLAADVIEAIVGAKPGAARTLYRALPVSDQAQMREFYLSKIEEVEPALRTKFSKLYHYY
jgi:hypothetical protein